MHISPEMPPPMSAVGDGSWREAGDLLTGSLVWVDDTPGGITPADPVHNGRWGVVTGIGDRPACDGNDVECLELTLDGDRPGHSVHVSSDRQLWATEPW